LPGEEEVGAGVAPFLENGGCEFGGAAVADLDLCAGYTGTLFDFHRYRRPEVYGRITAQRGPEVPAGVRAALDDNVESSAEPKEEGP